MRKIFMAFVALSAILFTQCSKEDENTSGGYDFMDQTAQGMIEGNTWTLKSGSATMSNWDDGQFSINLFEIESDFPCIDFLGGDQVFFSIDTVVGIYQLNFDLSGGTGQTVTIFQESTVMNNIATDGAVEITEIDRVNGVIKGKIDARFDSVNYINGNFEVAFCDILSENYEFKNQDAQGKIGGTSWTYAKGVAEDSYFSPGEIEITLTTENAVDLCLSWFDGDKITFEVPKQTGVYQLRDYWSGDDENYSVSIYSSSESSTDVATWGAIEIIEVDELGGTISGRIDATGGSDNFINGYFEVAICE